MVDVQSNLHEAVHCRAYFPMSTGIDGVATDEWAAYNSVASKGGRQTDSRCDGLPTESV